MGFKITRSQRLSAVIGISSVFFVAEISSKDALLFFFLPFLRFLVFAPCCLRIGRLSGG